MDDVPQDDLEIARFTAHIKRLDTPCWLWVGATIKGYGKIHYRGALVSAHRVSYELAYGPIPDGLQIDHLCRNHGCVNPEHLEAVTQAENIRRGYPFRPDLRNNPATHCLNGHALEGANVRVDRGYIVCRTCRREYNRTYAAQHPNQSHGRYVPTGRPPGRPKGSTGPNGLYGSSKLTPSQMADIKQLLIERQLRQYEIARRFGVSSATMSRLNAQLKQQQQQQRSA